MTKKEIWLLQIALLYAKDHLEEINEEMEEDFPGEPGINEEEFDKFVEELVQHITV
jgi:hypothetical protein